jgi:hypothetical protein
VALEIVVVLPRSNTVCANGSVPSIRQQFPGRYASLCERNGLIDFALEHSKREARVRGKSSATPVITAKYDGQAVAEDEVLRAQIVHYFPAGDDRDNKTENDPGEVPQYLFKSLNSAAEDIAERHV